MWKKCHFQLNRVVISESFSKALTSKLWNKKNTWCQNLQKLKKNWIITAPYGSIKSIWLIHLREGHTKFMGKIKLAILHEQNYAAWLVKNSKKVFSKLTWKISLSVSGEQAVKWAGTWPLVFLSQIFRYFPAF